MASLLPFVSPESRANLEVCTVAVLYEDAPARDFAVQLCEKLLTKFDGDLDFAFSWWRFKYLGDPQISQWAARKTASADLLVIFLHRPQDIPFEVKVWFQLWLAQRASSEGVLVVVPTPAELGEAFLCDDSYLRSLAARAKLDYLLLAASRQTVESRDHLREDLTAPDYSEPGQRPTYRHHSSGWGINE